MVWGSIVFVLFFGLYTWYSAMRWEKWAMDIEVTGPVMTELSYLALIHNYALAFEKIFLVSSFVFVCVAFWLKLKSRNN